MKIAKALKQKNVLVGELSKLKTRLSENNVRTDKNKFQYKNEKVLKDTVAKMEELIGVKTAIAVANGSVYEDIFRMAELKSLVQHLKSVPVQEGEVKQPSYNSTPIVTKYVSALGRVKLDALIAGYEEEIQDIQERLDAFNFTTEI